jgi:bis(5'-nucleosyl)-tetraphosphatase (symmetrical)
MSLISKSKLPFAIGDLQGCSAELHLLLAAIKIQEHDRPIWFAGDLVNRGPNSLNTIRLLMGLGSRVRVVLGNHDLHLLAMAADIRKPKSNDTAAEILDAPDAKEIIDWLRTQPLAIYQHDHLMVHAGLYPWWTVQQLLALTKEVESKLRGDDWKASLAQLYGNTPTCWSNALSGFDRFRFVINACTRMRLIDSLGNLEFESKESALQLPDGYSAWFSHPNIEALKTTIVFGHWSTQGLLLNKNLIGLDTGCVWGGKLTAVDLANRQLTQVNCAQHQVPG